jgi:hypothetical protein
MALACETTPFYGFELDGFKINGEYKVCQLYGSETTLTINARAEAPPEVDLGKAGVGLSWGIGTEIDEQIGAFVSLYSYRPRKQDFSWSHMSLKVPESLENFSKNPKEVLIKKTKRDRKVWTLMSNKISGSKIHVSATRTLNGSYKRDWVACLFTLEDHINKCSDPLPITIVPKWSGDTDKL